jgi:GT2 family glycosyltransferase
LFPVDVTIAIITFNALETHLPRAIAAALNAGCSPGQLLVIDVASTDGTAIYLRRHYPHLSLITLAENRGPNPARNRALLEAPTPYVLVMDVDVELLPGVADRMRDLLHDDPMIGVATPVVVYSDRPDIINYARTWLHFLGEASATHQDQPTATLGDGPCDVGACTGCAPMIRRSAAIEIGLFDERLFFGKTDGDFAYRMTIAGYRIVELSDARVLHHRQQRGSKFFDHQIANRWYFLLKNYQWRTLVLCAPALAVHEVALLLFLAAKGGLIWWWRGLTRFVGLCPALPAARAQTRRVRRIDDAYLLQGSNLVTPIPHQSRGILARMLRVYESAMSVYWSAIGTLLRGFRPGTGAGARGKRGREPAIRLG